MGVKGQEDVRVTTGRGAAWRYPTWVDKVPGGEASWWVTCTVWSCGTGWGPAQCSAAINPLLGTPPSGGEGAKWGRK